VCFLLTLLFLGPRAGIFFWWIVNPGRWERAFSSAIWPVLGFIFLPWTTLMWVAVAPFGDVEGWDFLWLGFGVLADFASYANSAYNQRDRIPGYA